jgi:hypothetical protein
MTMSVQAEGAAIRAVDTRINYLAPGSHINRRFVAPGQEVNTGTYEPYPVQVRDGRAIKDQFTLDRNGFVLARHRSAVKDFLEKEQVDRVYPSEAMDVVRQLTGAGLVTARGWMVRTSGEIEKKTQTAKGYTHQGGIQPPAGEAHIDFTPACAERMARDIYVREFPDARPFKRFIASSLWRAFSPPPQDWPLAVCDGNSVEPHEGTSNSLVIVDEIPDREAMLGPVAGEETAPAATIFPHNPNHCWWYFSSMTRDEVLLLKFYDSDHSRAWRVPHTAFFDPTFPEAVPRQSIEFRTFAFFV